MNVAQSLLTSVKKTPPDPNCLIGSQRNFQYITESIGALPFCIFRRALRLKINEVRPRHVALSEL